MDRTLKPTATEELNGDLADDRSTDVGGPIPQGILRSVTVSLDPSQGPCFLQPEIRLEEKQRKSIAFAEAEWIRSNADGPVDVFRFEGGIPIPSAAALVLNLRNDTGSEVQWRSSWAVER